MKRERRGGERKERGGGGGQEERQTETGSQKERPTGVLAAGRGGLKKVTSGPPEGAPARQGEKEKSREKRGREDIDQVTWGYTHPASVCALMYSAVTSLGGSGASVSLLCMEENRSE